MSKMIKAAKISNIVMAGVTVAEGVCAAIVVDNALKTVPGNKFVNIVGRSAVTSLICGACGFAANEILNMNKLLDETEDKHEGYRKLTIVDANNHKIKQWHKPGDLIHISARDLHSEETEFLYWYCTKGDVKLDDINSEVTSFIMPDENIRVEFAVFGPHVYDIDDDPKEAIDPEEVPVNDNPSALEQEPIKAADDEACDLVKDDKGSEKK